MNDNHKIYNPHCIVSYLYWEVSQKKLSCEKCPFMDCKCKECVVMKDK